jgi:NAD-dependent dihydropyrimidine dehydrogenase PreA subunit
VEDGTGGDKMTCNPYLLENTYPHAYYSAAIAGYQEPLQTLVIIGMAHMMIIGFAFLYLIFRRENISPKFLLMVLATILYMSVVTFVISYLGFWSDSPVVIPIILGSMFLTTIIAVFIFLLSPVLNSQEVIQDWRARYRYTIPLVVTLVFWELSMGFLYGSAFLPHDSSPFLLAVNNVDFSAMMIVEAIFFLLITRKGNKLPEFALFTFALSMALMPNFFIELGKLPVLGSTLISSLVMVVNILILYIMQIRSPAFNFQVMILALAAFNFLEMIGLCWYAATGSLVLISSMMVLAMVAYFFFVTHRLPSRPVPSYRPYNFALLVLISGAELSMGLGVSSLGFSITTALSSQSVTNYASYFSGLDLARSLNFNNPLWWLFPFDPIKMMTMGFHNFLSVNPFLAYFWASFMLVMATTMSPFFTIMMGSEMSYLVLERYRHTRNKSVKNWALAIMAGIPIFIILVPFYTQFFIFGMSGMLLSVPLLLMIISIAAIIVASVFFGRRAQCNLVCMAAHMWTNVYYDQFKPKSDRHQSIWRIIRWISFLIMVLSLVAFVLEKTGLMPPIMIGGIAVDMIFYGMFVLNYIWWYFYFLTPVFGAYSCARQGWCGFGTLAGIFGKLFFKIKTNNANACEGCETMECESSCPTAIPLQTDFLRKGYSNRITCIGCGDCVEACPQDNLRIVDARDYLRRRSPQI